MITPSFFPEIRWLWGS